MPAAPPPEISRLADELFDAVAGFRREARRVAQSFEAFTASQVELLGIVSRRPGLSVSEAAGALRLAVNTVSTLVVGLVEAGMLVREPDPADRRVARLRVTPAASRRIAGVRGARIAAVAEILQDFDASRRRQAADAVHLLEELAAAMAERARDER